MDAHKPPLLLLLLLLALALATAASAAASHRQSHALRFENANQTAKAVAAMAAVPDLDDPVNFDSKASQQLDAPQQTWREQPDRQLRFGVLFSDSPSDPLINKAAILSAIHLACERVNGTGGLLAGFNVTVEYRNTKGSSVYGPLEAMQMYLSKRHKPDAFLGPINDYVLAPVARYALVWNVPIISPGGTSDGFRLKAQNFPMLTSMRQSCLSMVPAVMELMQHFSWRHVAMLYQNDLKLQGLGDSYYSFQMGSLYNHARDVLDFSKTAQLQLDAADMVIGHDKYVEFLQTISNTSRSE